MSASGILDKEPNFIHLPGSAGKKIVVKCLLNGGPLTGPNQALIQFDFGKSVQVDAKKLGLARSGSASVGFYKYANTGPGMHSTTFTVEVPSDAEHVTIGLRCWWPSDEIQQVEFAAGPPRTDAGPECILFSVDVEALPGRALDNPVERLIMGRFGDKEYGIGRLCDLFEEAGVQATFFVDFAECAVYGDRAIFTVAEFLKKRNHDVQLHIHPEIMLRSQGWRYDLSLFPSFDIIDYSAARTAIECCIERFKACLGELPSILRPGGMKKSMNLLHAARDCGLPAVSTLYPNYDKALRQPSGNFSISRWNNGLLEIPVDFSLDPLIANERFADQIDASLKAKSRKFASLLLHSTSLLYREKRHTATFDRPDEGHEKVLRQHLLSLSSRYSFKTHKAVVADISKLRNLPALPIETLVVREKPEVESSASGTCNLCLTPFFIKEFKSDVCPVCSSRTRHRILKAVLQHVTGNVFEGKHVCANHATPMEMRHFLADAAKTVNFDIRPISYLDAVADAQDLKDFETDSFDVFYSNYVLNHVKDDRRSIAEIHRVLKPGGLAVIMAPSQPKGKTVTLGDVTRHYGQAALDKFGVGSYRNYGFQDLLDLLSQYFTVNHHQASDPLTNAQDTVFFCRAVKPMKMVGDN